MNAHKTPHLFSDGTSIKVLTFDVKTSESEKLELAINIQKIKEIVETDDFRIQSLSEKYYPVIGLINLRSQSVPVLDLNHFMNPNRKVSLDANRSLRIIVCEFQKLLLGIVVDKTHKIRQFDNSLVQKLPDAMSSLENNIFNGVLDVDGKFIQLLDIEYILTRLNVNVAPDKEAKTHVNLKDKHVLIVEDSRLFQKKLMEYFTRHGAKITVAEDGVEGIEKLRELGEVDLIFSDIEMPRLNGIGMVRKLKLESEFKDIPVIFNTSISNQGLIDDITSEKLGEYIVKFDEEEIGRALRKLLG